MVLQGLASASRLEPKVALVKTSLLVTKLYYIFTSKMSRTLTTINSFCVHVRVNNKNHPIRCNNYGFFVLLDLAKLLALGRKERKADHRKL